MGSTSVGYLGEIVPPWMEKPGDKKGSVTVKATIKPVEVKGNIKAPIPSNKPLTGGKPQKKANAPGTVVKAPLPVKSSEPPAKVDTSPPVKAETPAEKSVMDQIRERMSQKADRSSWSVGTTPSGQILTAYAEKFAKDGYEFLSTSAEGWAKAFQDPETALNAMIWGGGQVLDKGWEAVKAGASDPKTAMAKLKDATLGATERWYDDTMEKARVGDYSGVGTNVAGAATVVTGVGGTIRGAGGWVRKAGVLDDVAEGAAKQADNVAQRSAQAAERASEAASRETSLPGKPANSTEGMSSAPKHEAPQPAKRTEDRSDADAEPESRAGKQDGADAETQPGGRGDGASVEGGKNREPESQAKNKDSDCKSGVICGMTRRPVMIATGEKVLAATDFTLSGWMPLDWTRRYRSSNRHRGVFGIGWTLGLGEEIHLRGDHALLIDAEGRDVKLPWLESGQSVRNGFEGFKARRQDDIWTLEDPRGMVREFWPLTPDATRLRLRFLRDRNGNEIKFSYDGEQRWNGLIDSVGRQIAFDLKPDGRIRAVAIDGQWEVVYRYDDLGRLIAVRDRAGHLRHYHYDEQDRLLRYVDRLGHGFQAQYDEQNRVICTVADDGSLETQFDYRPEEKLTVVTDGLGNKQHFYFNDQKLVVRFVDAVGGESRYERNDDGDLTRIERPDGSVTLLRYDGRGNLTSVTGPDGVTSSQRLNEFHQPTTIVDPLGQSWEFAYDGRGNLVAETDPLGQTTSYEIGEKGQPLAIIDAKGGRKTLAWSGKAELLSRTDCSGQTTRYGYNPRSEVISVSNALDQTTRFEYDSLGRLQSVQYPDGSEERISLDPEGRLLAYEGAEGGQTRYRYDRHGRPILRVDAAGHSLEYHYDPLGRLAALVNANGVPYRFRYDAMGRLSSEMAFDGQVRRHRYDAGGRLQETEIQAPAEDGLSDPFVRHVVYEYDRAGRLLSKTNADGETRFAYDRLSRLIEAQQGDSTVKLFYDPLSRLVAEEQDGHRIEHRFDPLGNRLETLLPSGRLLGFLYYGSGHLHQINLAGEVISDFERDALYREVMRTQGTLQSRFLYDEMGRISAQVAFDPSVEAPTAVLGRTYHYGRSGQLLARHDQHRGLIQYEYDPVGRLLAAGEERFAFDPAGNPLGGDDAKVTSGDRVEVFQDCRYRYDAWGNVVEKKKGKHSVWQFQYDAQNRLIQAVTTRHGVSQTTRYYYDAFSRRIAKQDAFGETRFIWDGDRMVEELRGAAATSYVYKPKTFVSLAQIVGPQGEAGEVELAVRYYHTDQIGTPQELTTSTGQIAWLGHYAAWGNILKIESAVKEEIEQPLRFQGQYFDTETGLHYNRHRYYDADVGLFLSQDPIGLQGGHNLYVYAPNPVEWIDPLGLSSSKGIGLSPCCDNDLPTIPSEDLGELLGRGGNKDVFAYGENQAVGVLRPGKNRKAITDELDLLNKLNELGLPTVNARGPVIVDSQPALIFDRFAQGSKDVVKLEKGKVRIVGDSPLLNQQSISDLQNIRNAMVNKKIKIDDLQFLIGKDGRIVVADPLDVHVNTVPSTNNLRMIDLLIQSARDK